MQKALFPPFSLNIEKPNYNKQTNANLTKNQILSNLNYYAQYFFTAENYTFSKYN